MERPTLRGGLILHENQRPPKVLPEPKTPNMETPLEGEGLLLYHLLEVEGKVLDYLPNKNAIAGTHEDHENRGFIAGWHQLGHQLRRRTLEETLKVHL